jgi:hypothetical protein
MLMGGQNTGGVSEGAPCLLLFPRITLVWRGLDILLLCPEYSNFRAAAVFSGSQNHEY